MKKIIVGNALLLSASVLFNALMITVANKGTGGRWGALGRFWWAAGDGIGFMILVLFVVFIVAFVYLIQGNMRKSVDKANDFRKPATGAALVLAGTIWLSGTLITAAMRGYGTQTVGAFWSFIGIDFVLAWAFYIALSFLLAGVMLFVWGAYEK